MKNTYQLSPIPPFRATSSNNLVNTTSSTCPSTLSSQRDSLLTSPPEAECNENSQFGLQSTATDNDTKHELAMSVGSRLTSFAQNKKRPAPSLNKLIISNIYASDPEGLSAMAPPSPFVHQQLTNSSIVIKTPTSPSGAAPSPPGLHEAKKAPFIPVLSQPHGVVRSNPALTSSPEQDRSPKNLSPTSLSAKQIADQHSYFESLQLAMTHKNPLGQHASSYPPSDMHLTPPPTPNSRQEKLIGGLSKGVVPFGAHTIDPRLPLTPNTSPFAKFSLSLAPTTISAKALASHSLHPLFAANYDLGDELGSGGFGFVVQARRKSDGMECAVKFIYKEKVPQHAWVKDDMWGDENDVKGVMRTKDGVKRVPLEAYVLKTIRHRGVVSFVDLFEDKRYLYLVMEHHGSPWTASEKENKPLASNSPTPSSKAQGKQPLQPITNQALVNSPRSNALQMNLESKSRKGSTGQELSVPFPPMLRRSSCDLFECIEQHSRLPERHAKFVFAQLVDVVGCLHYNGFVHRDIKDENIVIDSKYRVKLIDFGSTYLFDYRQPVQTLTRFFGTLNFASPEVLKKGAYQPMAAEIWSLGILLTILVTGESFFRDTESIKTYRASLPTQVLSVDCMDLIFRCLAFNPEDRWNCFKIRTHPWLADSHWPWSELPKDACQEGISRVRKRVVIQPTKTAQM